MPDEIGFDEGSFSAPENKNITSENSRSRTPHRIALAKETLLYFPGKVEVTSEELGADAWQQMVNDTQKDKIERGFELTVKNGKIKRSAVFKGSEDTFLTPSSELFRQFLRREKMIGSFHTHPYDITVNTKAPTGTFSLRDFQVFANAPDSKIMGMLDIGGAHVLMKDGFKHSGTTTLPQGNFVHEAIKEVRDSDGVMLNAMWKISEIAERIGMSYYFTSDLKPDQNGLVTLKNVKSIDHIPPQT